MTAKPKQSQVVESVQVVRVMRRNVFVTLLAGAVVTAGCFAVMRSPYHPNPWMDFLSLMGLMQIVVFCGAGAILMWQKQLVSVRRRSIIALTLLSGTLLGASVSTLGFWIIRDIANFDVGAVIDLRLVFLRSGAVSLLMTIILLWLFNIYRAWQADAQRAIKARTQALQSRIRPHFLFNTLNTIAELTSFDPRAAELAIEDLARLYRTYMADTGVQHSLEAEITTCKAYLSIEQYRFGGRLTIAWDVQEVPLQAQVPILCLQPLLENALYHGIEPLPEGGELKIRAWQDRHIINITVINPRTELPSSRQGNKLAIDNIEQRLKLHFGDEGRLVSHKVEDEYHVTLSFPYTETIK